MLFRSALTVGRVRKLFKILGTPDETPSQTNAQEMERIYLTIKEFLKKNPKVEKLLEVASIPLADIAAQNMQMNKGEKSERQVKDHAKAWVKINQKTFDSWIAAAK